MQQWRRYSKTFTLIARFRQVIKPSAFIRLCQIKSVIIYNENHFNVSSKAVQFALHMEPNRKLHFFGIALLFLRTSRPLEKNIIPTANLGESTTANSDKVLISDC